MSNTKEQNWNEVYSYVANMHANFFGEVTKIMEKLGVERDTAMAIAHLRSKNYWTQEKENELLKRDAENCLMPNMFDLK